jgi:hypothetical protein
VSGEATLVLRQYVRTMLLVLAAIVLVLVVCWLVFPRSAPRSESWEQGYAVGRDVAVWYTHDTHEPLPRGECLVEWRYVGGPAGFSRSDWLDGCAHGIAGVAQ